jgi:hypothetical protein
MRERKGPIASFISSYCLFLSLLIPSGLSGGSPPGSIEGFVRDSETGEPLAGVSIRAPHTGCAAASNNDGSYSLEAVPEGSWSVEAHAPGYLSVLVNHVDVRAGTRTRVDFDLKGVLIDVLGIEIAPDPFDADGSTKQMFDSTAVRTLPCDNYREIIALGAGTTLFDDVSNAQYPVSVRGGRPSDDAVYVDGVNVGQYHESQNLLDVPEFGIEEIALVSGVPDAALGNAQSGVVSIATMEGRASYSGNLRFETDELMPAGSNYGFNRAEVSVGGPIPAPVKGLTFFFSGELTGRGDMHPRADGFRGRNEDISWLAERYSFSPEVREFLGHDLDITQLLQTARQASPAMPVLDIEDERMDGGDHPGRQIGNEGDETRILGKLAWHPRDGIALTGTILADRDQGLLFDPGMVFWDSFGNGVFKRKNTLGILGYSHAIRHSGDRSTVFQVRANVQRSTTIEGPRFNLNSYDEENFGKDLGFEDLTNIMNYRVGSIPIFLEDLRGSDIQSLQDIFDNSLFNFQPPRSVNGNNPFGIPVAGFLDADVGYYGLLRTTEENRTGVRLDVESQVTQVHRVRAGADLSFWEVDWYSNNLSSYTFLDYLYAEPQLESFYLEDRIRYRDLLIDLGLRVDSFHSGIEYPSVLGDQESGTRKPERKTVVAPRLSVSHGLSERVQVRAAYGTSYQIPEFPQLYSALHFDSRLQWNSNRFLGDPNLDLRKITTYELGITGILSDDWTLDLVGYHSDYDRDVAARYIQQNENMPFMRTFTNDAYGTAQGLDLALRKRFSSYLSADIAYSLLSSKSTDLDPTHFVENEGFFFGGDEPPVPPVGIVQTEFDQTHTIDLSLYARLPEDYRRGTAAGTLFRNTGFSLTLQAHSGRPYYTIDNNRNFTGVMERTKWFSVMNLRVTRDFSWGGLGYSVFADIRNLLGTSNLSALQQAAAFLPGIMNGVYQASGSPYSDGGTVKRAIDDLRISDPSLYTGPRITDINGDGSYDEFDLQEITRRLDFNGDGTVTVDEELAMRILAEGASDADPRHFDIPRLVRVGFEVRF